MLYSRIECNSQVQEAKIPFIFSVGELLFNINIKPFKDRGSVRLLWSEQLTVYDPQSFSAVVPNLVFMPPPTYMVQMYIYVHYQNQ